MRQTIHHRSHCPPGPGRLQFEPDEFFGQRERLYRTKLDSKVLQKTLCFDDLQKQTPQADVAPAAPGETKEVYPTEVIDPVQQQQKPDPRSASGTDQASCGDR
jgi:hypothetical protein